MLEAHRRDIILQAIATSAEELLRTGDLKLSIPKVLEHIGHATDVDRVHLLAVDPAWPIERGCIIDHKLWCAAGIPPPTIFNDARGQNMVDVGLRSWVPRLMRGESISGHVRNFEISVRKFFEFGGVKSVLAVPVFVDDRWWGLIGFDDCQSERKWSPADIGTLKTLAELVGAAVTHADSLQKLADANRIIESSSTILFRLSPQKPFQLIYLSQNVRRYGYEADELLASPSRWWQLFESEHHPTIVADITSIIEGKADNTLAELSLKKPDGSHVWFEGRASAVRDGEHRLVAIEGVLTDITERKRSESERSFSHILLTTAIESSPDAILAVDANSRIIMFNRHFVELWEIPQEAVSAGLDAPVLASVVSRMKNENEFLARVRFLYDHPEIHSYEEIETKDGRVIERHSGSLYDTGQKYLGRVWFFRDITEKKRAGEKIAALARTDALTGLPNRAAFLERLQLAFARARRGANPFAVHYLDLDHFKDVNDTLGHPIGDALLCAVATRLRTCVRDTDMVARFGGDEFAVLQDDVTGVGSVETLAAKIGESLAVSFSFDGNQVHTTASIGIVPYRADVQAPEDMMMKADLALYRAKDEGRNQYRFHVAELDQQVRERVMIGDDLRLAIERNEFELYYQPQVELASGRIVGLEALIRWNHPIRGLLLPASFVPTAETNGSILPIGQWAIEQVCRQIRLWLDQGITPPLIAVNISAVQFKLASNLDRIVAESLGKYHIAPRALELELTESALMETTQKYREAFERLRRIGVRLAIDDFGTGYSSFSYLRSFRVSRLKIDREFIGGVMTNPDDATIVRATISLAHELGIEVVAEGVETAEQQAFLISAGCRLAQGYHLGRPMRVDPATELLRQVRPHERVGSARTECMANSDG